MPITIRELLRRLEKEHRQTFHIDHVFPDEKAELEAFKPEREQARPPIQEKNPRILKIIEELEEKGYNIRIR